MMPEYLSYKLTGEMKSEYTISSTSSLLNAQTRDWDMEIIKIKKQTRLKANYPYVIRPKNEGAINLNITQFYETLYSTASEYQKDVTCSSAFKQYAVKGVYTKTVSADLDNGNYVYAINKKGEWQKMGLETSLLPFRLYLTMEIGRASCRERV